MSDVLFALSLLTPWDIDKPKTRVGPLTDGGYILVNDLDPDQSIVSYGIDVEYRFDQEMARKGHKVYMFDHTIDGIQSERNMFFYKEGVSGLSSPSEFIYTIDDHLERHGISGDRLVLKMDVEGCEYDAFIGVSEKSLHRFEQITFEVHDLNKLGDPLFRKNFIKMFLKINEKFTLFHVHANNYDGANTFHYIDGLAISNLLELSYIRTSRIERSISKTLYPTFLDYPNVGDLDKRLWMYPFFPTKMCLEDFAASYSRTSIQFKVR